MVVLERFRRIDPPVTGHAEVEDQAVAAIRVDDAVFGATMQADDASAGQPLAEVDGKRTPEVGTPCLDASDPTPIQHSRKAAYGRLDFGELGHEPRYGEAQPSPLEPRPDGRQ